MLIVFYYSCSYFKGRISFRECGQLYILKKKIKLHCSSSPKLLYSSRNRWKTITIWNETKWNEYSFDHFLEINCIFCFHFSRSLCHLLSLAPMPWKYWGSFLHLVHCAARVVGLGQAGLVLVLFPVSLQSRGAKNLFLCSYLAAKPIADQKWLGPNG